MATVTPGKIFTANEIVTPANLNALGVPTVTLTSGEVIPPGAIMPFAMNSAPSGWLAADGAAVSRTTYATLFAAIGALYGAGNGSTTFNLPDLRGYFVRGSGTNADGTSSGSFGLKQADGFKSHTHTENSAGSHAHTGSTYAAGSHTHTISGWTTDDGGGAYVAGSPTSGTTRNISNAGDHSHTLAIASGGDHTHTINATGTTETRPANIAMLYCIKI